MHKLINYIKTKFYEYLHYYLNYETESDELIIEGYYETNDIKLIYKAYG